MRAWVPRGRPLPDGAWRGRQRTVVVLLVAHAVGFAVWSVLAGQSWWICLINAGVPGGAAWAAVAGRFARRTRTCIAALGLVCSSAIFVQLSGGLVECHFHFFVMIPIVALYEDWLPFGLAVAVVLVHHGVIGTTVPHLVYDTPAAWAHPWRYACVHAAFFGAACIGAIVNWRLQEISREQQVQLAARLRHQASHDPLTGLPNRAHLREEGRRVLQLGASDHRATAVLLVDLDDFKDINDTLGHASGDVLLTRLGPLMDTVIRPSDVIARLGGDEFAAVVAVADEAAAVAVARRLLDAISQPIEIDGVRLCVGASIGIAIDSATTDIDVLLRQADVAMYSAKRARSGFAVYAPEQETSSTAQLSMLADLRRALEAQEIVLHYQPKVALDDGRVVGVEALARWQHPARGLLSPLAFIPAVDNSGLVLPFTLYVLDKALAQAATWSAAGHDLTIAVNMSPRCLAHPDVVDRVLALLRQHRIQPDRLVVEITEQALAVDGGSALSALTALHTAGVSFSIDDFGTGYSSLSRLGGLPVDELKIDRTFVARMLESGECAALVRSMIDLGHNLGLTVVAEGIEDQATVDALAAQGCDTAQGYHLGRPMTGEAFAAWLPGYVTPVAAHGQVPHQRAGGLPIRLASAS